MRNPSSSTSAAASSHPSLSPAEGFLRVKDGVDGMIKHVANEPSVGLFFVQRHAGASMPVLLDAKGKLVEKTREVTLQTEDMEDSICAVRSMSEFGLPLADDMIKDINKSLQIMSKTRPKRGLIQNPSWGFQSWKSSGTWDDLSTSNGGSSQSYLSSMFNTAKQKASSLGWPQPESATRGDSSEDSASNAVAESSEAGGQGLSSPDTEREELPLSSQLSDVTTAVTMHATDTSETLETFNKFKEEQELKLQKWLRETEEAEDNKD